MNEQFDPAKHEQVEGGGFALKEAVELRRRAEDEAKQENFGRDIQARDAAARANAKRSLLDKVLGRNKAEAKYDHVSGLDILEANVELPVEKAKEIESVKIQEPERKPVEQKQELSEADRRKEDFLTGEGSRRFMQAVSSCLEDSDSRVGSVVEVQNQLNEIARIFGAPEITSDRYHQGHHTVDNLLSKIDPKKNPDFYGALLQSFVFFGRSGDQNDWDHSVCHNFESYDRGGKSVFDLPNADAVKVVLEELGERALNGRRLSDSAVRILLPLVNHNMDSISSANLDGDFPARPAIFTREDFLKIILPDSKYGDFRALRIFCTAKTPREFFVAAINQGIPLVPLEENGNPAPGFMTAEQRSNLTRIFDAIKDVIPSEVFDAYLKKYFKLQDQNLTIEQVVANTNLAEQATDLEKGVFVDVDGTLISPDGTLNKGLLDMINLADMNGDPVIIFTGGDPERQTALLREIGLPEKFLPVRSKAEYKGKVLGFLVDDTPADMQGFRARSYRCPSYSDSASKHYERARQKWQKAEEGK